MLVFIPSDQFLVSVGCYLLEANGGTLRGSGLDLMRGFGGLFMSQKKTTWGPNRWEKSCESWRFFLGGLTAE